MQVEKRPVPDCLTVTELPNEEFKRYGEELIGEEELQKRLLTHIQICLALHYFLAWKQQYNSNGLIPQYMKGVLLVGPSGTGKTLTAKGSADAYARLNQVKVYFAELGSVRGKFVGESSKNVGKAFDYAEYLAEDSCVIFFIDEFDSIGVSRNTEQMHEDVRAMVNTLNSRMNQIRTKRIFIIAASNLEKHVDYATKRRFDYVLYFKRPSLDQRLKLFEHFTQGWNFSTKDLLKLGSKTKRYTHNDINRVVNLAEEKAFLENKPLLLIHLLSAINQIKPTEEYDNG